jgi:hypothetical protein
MVESMFGRPKPPKYLGSDRQARVTTILVIALIAILVFLVITLAAVAFSG